LSNRQKFYINGEWVQPTTTEMLDVINPATEQPIEAVAMGGAEDVNKAVAAAKEAFETFSQTTKEERIALLEAVIAKYAERMGDIAAVISEEMGAPAGLAAKAQAPTGIGHLMTAVNVLKDFEFEEDMGTTRVIREPAGVRFHYSLELANKPDRLQGRSSAGGGLHHGAQALRSGPV